MKKHAKQASWIVLAPLRPCRLVSAPPPKHGKEAAHAARIQAVQQRSVPRHVIRPDASTHGPWETRNSERGMRKGKQWKPGQPGTPASGIFAARVMKGVGGLLRFSRRAPRHRVRRATHSRYYYSGNKIDSILLLNPNLNPNPNRFEGRDYD